MSSRRLQNLKKKEKTPSPAKKKSSIVFLYYSDKCEYCRELIKILMRVSLVAERIKCINVNEFDVDEEIDALPTIDDGSDELFKLESAFSWVMHQVYALVDKRKIKSATVAVIERDVKNVFLKIQTEAVGSVRDHDIMRTDLENPNPNDKYKADMDDTFGEYDYSGKYRMKEAYKKALQDAQRKPRPKGSLEERAKKYEEERQRIMNTYIRQWEKQGGPPESRTTKRENLRSTKMVSEAEIKRFENERQRMLEDAASKYDRVPIREPIKRQSFKMGTAVTEKDIHAYEAERMRMLQKLENKYR